MTVPGVNLIVAATFMARDRRHPPLPRRPQLTAYLGLDPTRPPVRDRPDPPRPDLKARLSPGPPRAGRSELERGPPPGPMRAFYQRVRARRGHQIAIVATARKLASLFWCLLTREQTAQFNANAARADRGSVCSTLANPTSAAMMTACGATVTCTDRKGPGTPRLADRHGVAESQRSSLRWVSMGMEACMRALVLSVALLVVFVGSARAEIRVIDPLTGAWSTVVADRGSDLVRWT